jgi:hypothetical protein
LKAVAEKGLIVVLIIVVTPVVNMWASSSAWERDI